MIKYIGSKRTLIPTICSIVEALPEVTSCIDLFSGTSRVGHALKGKGFQVFSNDLNTYAATIARCYVQANLEDWDKKAAKIIAHCNQIKPEEGYFTETFCKQALFFQPKNGAKVDAIREWIETQDFEPELKAIILISLMEAADRVDSTTGVQMAYLKSWAPRAHNDLKMKMPDILPQAKHGKSKAFQMDAFQASKVLKADLAYLDPPYNQHKYLGNYHIWESLVRWDKPEFYGIAKKRIDVKDRKSPFNSKPRATAEMASVIKNLDARYLVVSFSDEGYISRDEMVKVLSERGHVHVINKDYKRYVGAQIGIHSTDGRKVGSVSHLSNTEYIFIVAKEKADLERVKHG
jgi:adenine-specific DNA-methyltransferase